MKQPIDPDLAVFLTEVAPESPERLTGRRHALVLVDGTVIAFAQESDARALIERERLQLVGSIVELRNLKRHRN